MMISSNPMSVLVTIFGAIICCLANHENVYMEDYCNKKVRIKSTQNILLSEDMFYPTGWRCQMTVEAPPNHVIWINFHYFDVGRPSVIYCTDVLRIYDGDDTQSPEISPSKGLCGRFVPKPVATSGNQATFKFKSMVTATSTGFRLTATVQRKPESKICSKDEFQCLDDFCIDKKLKCDGKINCRDQSDESAQYAGCEGVLAKWTDLTTAAKVAIIVGFFVVTFLSICLIVTCCYSCCSSQKKYKRLQD
ncbi:low-density lipoprotein receptor-related protein 12-like [Ostrea edulis]|uniref:low-density lipoprotein receptor-related protein 12-like n=1 Tax=Ostrea edulis TaxID=37623 RepID=UPI002094E88C|nr:low-density lipoprotein receptor-related protein 12-like [Ostrea edulis]